MTTEQLLGPHLVGNTIHLPDGSWVDRAFFENLFADAIAAGTYAELIAADYAEDANGAPIRNRGYRALFDQLKAEGRIT